MTQNTEHTRIAKICLHYLRYELKDEALPLIPSSETTIGSLIPLDVLRRRLKNRHEVENKQLLEPHQLNIVPKKVTKGSGFTDWYDVYRYNLTVKELYEILQQTNTETTNPRFSFYGANNEYVQANFGHKIPKRTVILHDDHYAKYSYRIESYQNDHMFNLQHNGLSSINNIIITYQTPYDAEQAYLNQYGYSRHINLLVFKTCDFETIFESKTERHYRLHQPTTNFQTLYHRLPKST